MPSVPDAQEAVSQIQQNALVGGERRTAFIRQSFLKVADCRRRGRGQSYTRRVLWVVGVVLLMALGWGDQAWAQGRRGFEGAARAGEEDPAGIGAGRR
jgi:hypothetical protein